MDQTRFFSTDTFTSLNPQIWLGIHSMLMSLWSSWALDIIMLMASYLSVEAIAALTVMRSIVSYTIMLPVGLSTTASTLIGISIGTEDRAAIKHFWNVLMTSSVFIGLFEVTILYFAKSAIKSFFTRDDP